MTSGPLRLLSHLLLKFSSNLQEHRREEVQQNSDVWSDSGTRIVQVQDQQRGQDRVFLLADCVGDLQPVGGDDLRELLQTLDEANLPAELVTVVNRDAETL